MSEPPLEGVYLSAEFDLEPVYADAFARLDLPVRLRRPEAVEDPSRIAFALAWRPHDDAFRPYTALRHAGSIAAGVDHLLDCPSLPDDAVVTRIVDPAQADMMAAWTLAHLVWHLRGFDAMRIRQREARWVREAPPAARDWPVGVLGAGVMGRRVAALVRQAGYPVRLASRTAPDAASLPPDVEVLSGEDAVGRIAATSRVLVNLLPLTDATRGLLDAALFARLPEGSVLLQFGRGEQLVEADLLDALETGRLASASIDVTSVEPLPPEHPFWTDPRIFLTPHVAADADVATVARQTAEAALAVAADRPVPNRVDRRAGY